ncbi:hypothetical protein MYX75_01675 [Acidobacteria bacterium AH-259-A15]|nr:hypothetical protein [Acidobacteria bacterium AH-259-A15]
MFEAQEKQGPRSPIFWKILVVSVFLFVGLAVLLVFTLEPGAKNKVELTGVLRGGDPDYQWYGKYVKLKNPQIKMTRNFAGNRMVIFSGIIENNGEKTLDAVEVELNFFNYDQLVLKTTRTPIRPGPGTYTPPIEPLEQRGFTLYMENFPEDWLASRAEMAIHGFRFLSQPSAQPQ